MSNLAGFIPTNLTVVQHSTRDITFILPKPVPEVGFLEANYEKRLSTATSWAKDRASKFEKPLIDLKNLPATGFSIETLNGRYRTEVEYICVRHPEGYVFEVPFQNLLDIIKEVGCGVGGIIDKPCYMFSMGGKWRLIPVGGDMDASAQEADKESRKFVADKKVNAKKKMSVGQVVKMRDYDGYWVYLGKHKVGIFGGDYSYLLKAGEEPKLGEVVTKEQAKAITGHDRFWVDSVELWTPRVLDRQSPKFKFKIMKGV